MGRSDLSANPGWKKDIVLFLGSQTISLFGSQLVQYAIFWYITLTTQSGAMLTISILCGFLPTFFLSPFAGVWADRYHRKMLIVLSDAMIALATLMLALFFLFGYDALWLLFVMSGIRALGAAVQMPAVGAMIPQLVPADQLTRVNAINGSIQSFVMLVSPVVSAALLSVASLEIIFFVDVVTAAVAIAIVFLFVRVPVHAKALHGSPSGYFTDMQKGFRYIKDHEYARKYFLFCAVFFVLAAPAAFLTPLQVARSFGDDIWRLTAIEIAFSTGMIVGGAVLASWGGFQNKIHTMTLSCLMVGACTFALGVVPNFWVYLFFMWLTGVAMPFFNTPSMVLLQENVEEDFLGRVFGIFTMLSSSMMPLGMLVFGPVADVVQIEWLLVGTGLLVFVQAFFLGSNKALVEAGKPKPKEIA